MPGPLLQVENVWKVFGETRALSGVTVVIERGEVFGLLGPNGAGKTTLMSVLAGLLPPDHGRVLINGDWFQPARRDMRKLVGIGTQDLAIYPELTANENLQFFGKLYGLRGSDLSNRVQQVLQSVGLSDRSDQRAGTFSGGMKRRLNMAVAVIHRPILLLLDEPTTGVDPQSRNHLFELVKDLNRDGMTVIYSSHYMEEVQTLCNRIAILDHGQMKACSTLPKLLAMLEGTVRIGVDKSIPGFANRLTQIPGITQVTANESGYTIAGGPLGAVVARIAGLCSEIKIELTTLDAAEPNLEKVFLHLTGRGLRD